MLFLYLFFAVLAGIADGAFMLYSVDISGFL